MPFYDVTCERCGPGEVKKSMDEVDGQWTCPCCLGEAKRLFSPPYDHSKNTFHPYYSDALSPTDEKTYVSSRADEKRQMMSMGMARYEKGMIADNKRLREEQKRTLCDGTIARVKDSTIRKLYHAKNYGYAPTRGD